MTTFTDSRICRNLNLSIARVGWGCILATVALCISGCAAPLSPACVAAADVVCTTQGAVRGIAENGTLAFKGIPYAQAPVGQFRWHAPEPPHAWSGMRDGSRFGAVCPQISGKDVIGEEDCLTLNVWKP